MKKLFLILLLIPAISYAVWYNPFSWFKKGQANISQSVKCEPKIAEKVVEKPIECKLEIKEVEKIVYKDNPLQSAKIKELENSVKDCKNNFIPFSSVQSLSTQMGNLCVKKIQEEMNNANQRCSNILNQYSIIYRPSNTMTDFYLQGIRDELRQLNWNLISP